MHQDYTLTITVVVRLTEQDNPREVAAELEEKLQADYRVRSADVAAVR